MAGSDILQAAGRSLTGAVEKAYLQFEDKRLQKDDKVQVTDVAAKSLVPTANTLAKAAQTVKGTLQAKGMDKTLKLLKAAEKLVTPSNQYEVKFNPSEVTFQAKGGSGTLVQKMNFATAGKVSAKFSEMKTHIIMTVPLIFDDLERTDAFMIENISDPAAFLKSGVLSGVNQAISKSYTIRPQVEGFIGALHNEKTRIVKFCWGEMSYRGLLRAVDAEYTMFNREGEPIRATVNLQILLADGRIQDNDMGTWETGYQNAFGANSSSLGHTADAAGNLLHMNL